LIRDKAGEVIVLLLNTNMIPESEKNEWYQAISSSFTGEKVKTFTDSRMKGYTFPSKAGGFWTKYVEQVSPYVTPNLDVPHSDVIHSFIGRVKILTATSILTVLYEEIKTSVFRILVRI